MSMTEKQLKATYNSYVRKYGEDAIDAFVAKYPESEGDLMMLVNGEFDEIAALRAGLADEDYLPDAEEVPETLAELQAGQAGQVEQAEPAKAAPKAPKKPKATKLVKIAKGPSKAERAAVIFAESAGMSRKEIIERFQKELGMTPAGASTYYSNIKKKQQ